MKIRHVLAIMIAVCAILLAGCSDKGDAVTSSSQQAAQQTASQDETYSEKSVPLENVDVNDLRSIEITPSGDPDCFLSPCDCNCYPVKNVPLHAKKAMCATNCRQEYGISGCVFREYRCSAIQS